MNLQLKQKMMRTIRRQGVKDEHEVEAIADDVFLETESEGFEVRRAKQKAIDAMRKRHLKVDFSLDAPASGDDEESVSTYDIYAYDDFNERKAELQANQRHLISQLVSGSDERTTLIVQTFLQSDKPSITNVAKQLGMHHEVVGRALRRLQRNYSETQFGSYKKYLSA